MVTDGGEVVGTSGFDVEFENYGSKRTASFDVTPEGALFVDVDGEYSFDVPPAVARALAELVLGAQARHAAEQSRREAGDG